MIEIEQQHQQVYGQRIGKSRPKNLVAEKTAEIVKRPFGIKKRFKKVDFIISLFKRKGYPRHGRISKYGQKQHAQARHAYKLNIPAVEFFMSELLPAFRNIFIGHLFFCGFSTFRLSPLFYFPISRFLK